MFPYVCLATMPLFFENDWPRKVYKCWMKGRSESDLNTAAASESSSSSTSAAAEATISEIEPKKSAEIGEMDNYYVFQPSAMYRIISVKIMNRM